MKPLGLVMVVALSILVDKSDNTLRLLDGAQAIKVYPVATGKNNSTPVGIFKITSKLEDPTWYKPGGGIYPPGDKGNKIGTRWMGISKAHYGIHGTTEPETIGQQVSDGCVRMKNKDVEELFKLVAPGTPVTIQD